MDGTNGFSHTKQQIGERIVCQNVHSELVYNGKYTDQDNITVRSTNLFYSIKVHQSYPGTRLCLPLLCICCCDNNCRTINSVAQGFYKPEN